ncbi:MAG TPA: hypothetical protein VE775_03270, partial [Pyrinomonadaceae bacterium]|nr:hypothetical protein [Pyrinomonadaceae bacterium]
PQDNSNWGTTRVHLTTAVPSGSSATFNFTVVAPTTPGSYHFQWQMVRDGVAWFGNTSPDVVVSVSAPAGGGPAPARTDPLNRTGQPGDDLLSRNFNWSVPLVGLKGRAGLDLGLALSYNSLVWTKDGSTMTFDADQGDPTPGFRLGFPVIQGPYYNNQVGVWTYMLLTPAGARVELRQVGTSNAYESADSSYLRLLVLTGGQLQLWTPDGTCHSYVYAFNNYRCWEIKDRNGNYIRINYDGYQRLLSVVDTLGRTLSFTYDAYNKPLTIEQTWQREVLSGTQTTMQTETHTWATFGYSNLTIQTNFPGLTLAGSTNGQTIPVLTQVGTADGTRYNFDYTTYGQVYRITRSTQDDDLVWRPRQYVKYNLPLDASAAQTDCPRFTERRDWASNWHGDNGDTVATAAEEVVTTYSAWDATGASAQVTMPDGAI